MAYNAHRLFYQAGELPCLKAKLVITETERKKLLDCRRKVRAALRSGLRDAGRLLPRQQYFSPVFLEAAGVDLTRDLELKPRFRTQGSWAYDTLNRPAKPVQQIDLDEGMYVPMSIVKNGPAVASTALFFVVEKILGRLCEDEGWKMDTSKSICVRLEVDADTHVDLNIYAIPDEKMELLEKAAVNATGRALDSDFPIGSAARQIRIDPEEVYVAHRKKGWEQSDPLELEEWFNKAVERHSAWTDLRRITRYLKAWRDERWEASCLSSIALMVCAVEALDEANTPPIKNRDDDGLLVVARALSGKLTRTIPNPVVDGKSLNDHWTVSERNEAELAARALCDEMEAALQREDSAHGVLSRIRKLFGHRVPNDVTLVSAMTSISQVRATPAKQAPSPKVGTSTSG